MRILVECKFVMSTQILSQIMSGKNWGSKIGLHNQL